MMASGTCNPSASRISGPSIAYPWQREAIIEIVEYWKKHAPDHGCVKLAAKAARHLLWLLPEARNGTPITNPLNGKKIRQPNKPRDFHDAVWGCVHWDNEILNIVRRHEPKPEHPEATSCLACLGTGWKPTNRWGKRVDCSDCGGSGEVS